MFCPCSPYGIVESVIREHENWGDEQVIAHLVKTEPGSSRESWAEILAEVRSNNQHGSNQEVISEIIRNHSGDEWNEWEELVDYCANALPNGASREEVIEMIIKAKSEVLSTN